MAWVVYQWSLSGRREGSLGTIFYFRAPRLFQKKKKKEEVGEKWQEGIGTSIWKR